MTAQIAELVTFCQSDNAVRVALENMRPHILHFAVSINAILRGKQKNNISTLAPYIGRGLLEASFTALLFRIDPFRALTLMRFQSHAEFDHNRPNNISINWGGDLMSEVEEGKDIWLPKNKPENVSRALLSPYNDEVIWQPAFLDVLDYIDNNGVKFSFPTMLTDDPDAFVKRVRGEARQLYSFWSKGIHCEFFAMSPTILDAVTCAEKLRRSADIAIELALLSHFTKVSVGNCNPAKAVRLFSRAKETLHG